jgi:hypothetical protein
MGRAKIEWMLSKNADVISLQEHHLCTTEEIAVFKAAVRVLCPRAVLIIAPAPSPHTGGTALLFTGRATDGPTPATEAALYSRARMHEGGGGGCVFLWKQS